MLKYANEPINITRFPDGTSQVWKLSNAQLEHTYKNKFVTVEWEFENEFMGGESEIISVLQLLDLLLATSPDICVTLNCPFLPYGRQDKHISNGTTFGLSTFLPLFNDKIVWLSTLDAHPDLTRFEDIVTYELENVYPSKYIDYAISQFGATKICFPDFGASQRYQVDLPTIVLKKYRDQSTGYITGMTIDSGSVEPNDRILIVDDICDGGKTFIEAAKILNTTVALYTTHGIYSRGRDILIRNNITPIYNRKSCP